VLKRIKYTKKNKEVSIRVIHQIGLVNDDKVLAVDLTGYSAKEQEKLSKQLKAIREEYIDMIKRIGLGDNFRYFFLDKMEEQD